MTWVYKLFSCFEFSEPTTRAGGLAYLYRLHVFLLFVINAQASPPYDDLIFIC